MEPRIIPVRKVIMDVKALDNFRILQPGEKMDPPCGGSWRILHPRDYPWVIRGDNFWNSSFTFVAERPPHLVAEKLAQLIVQQANASGIRGRDTGVSTRHSSPSEEIE